MERLEAFRKIDWLMLVSVVALLGIGLIILHALTIKEGGLAENFDPTRQLLFAAAGLILMLLLMKFDFHLWARLALPLYGIGLILLVLVIIMGQETLGAARWIDVGFFQFQPSEFIKLGVVLVLAKLFSERYDSMPKFRYFLLSLLVVMVPVVLVILQPDLGSALVIGAIWMIMVATTTTKKWYLVALVLLTAVSLPLAISNLEPYQQERLQTFTNPAADPQGAGYNVNQATIAVGSGQLFGRGLTSGTQSQLNFLPSQHTDFIFAVIAEKLGFVGASLVLVLFVILLLRILRVAWETDDRLGFFLAIGVLAMLLTHVVVNIGMNLQLLPVTGIPLPLVSFGGTNLIVTLVSFGLLLSILLHRKELAFKE